MRRPSAGSSLVRFVTPLKQWFVCCTVVCDMKCLAHTVGFAFTPKVPQKTMVATLAFFVMGFPLAFISWMTGVKFPLRRIFFAKGASPTTWLSRLQLFTFVAARRSHSPPWSHSWWIRIFRCEWRWCWGTNTTLPDVKDAVELSEGWQTTGVGNPRDCNRIIDPPV